MNAQSFNVTLIQPPGYIHSEALSEAAAYLHAMLLDCGYQSRLSRNDFDPSVINVLFCAHLLESRHLPLLPKRTIIFNSEQLSNRDGWYFQNGVYGQLLATHFVWDYSASHLEKIPHPRKAYIPFGFSSRLRHEGFRRQPGNSLLFYGSITPYREQVFDALRSKNVVVDVLFGVYGQERDEKMRCAAAVLNLHNSNAASAFEPIRCFYPLINGVPVISESVDDEATVAHFKEAIFFGPSAQFADFVADLLAKPVEFERKSRDQVKRFEEALMQDHIHKAAQMYIAANE
jgi:hypothetical protein